MYDVYIIRTLRSYPYTPRGVPGRGEEAVSSMGEIEYAETFEGSRHDASLLIQGVRCDVARPLRPVAESSATKRLVFERRRPQHTQQRLAARCGAGGRRDAE